MQPVLKKIISLWWIIIPGAAFFLYVVLRAHRLSLTWDEAHTFFEYVRNPHWLPDGYNYMSANNHLLNTWLMKCSVFLFGESELALRLPNVLAGGFYFFAAGALAQKLAGKRWQALLVFVVLSANPFVLDFFSVARGYGISIALLMLGILQLTKYILDKQEIKNGIYAQLFLAGAVLANLTMIHVLLAITFLLMLNRFVFHRNDRLSRSLMFISVVPLIMLAMLAPYLRQMKASGAFFYGEEARSLGDTFLSLSKASAYGTAYSSWIVPFMTVLVSAIPLISVIYLMRNALVALKTGQGRWLVFITLTLFFAITGPMLQHLLFGTNFLSGRTALFYIPLIALNFIGILILCPPRVKNVLLMAAGIFSAAHFYFSYNLYFTYDWKEQADVKAAMLTLRDKKIPVAENCFANMLSTDLPFEKQINYYRMRLQLANYSHAARKESVPACSSYYLETGGYDKISREEKNLQKENLRDFWLSETWLFHFPPRTKSQALKFVKEVWQDFEHEDPYRELKTDTIYFGDKGTFAGGDFPYSISVPLEIPDSIKSELVATMSCRLYYYTRNTSALLVFSFDDGSAESWEAMHITELPEKPLTWSITSWTRPVPAGTKKIRIYLWNTDKTPVLMDNVALRLLSAEN